MTTEGLLRVARIKKNNDNTNALRELPLADRCCSGLETALPWSAHLKKQKIDKR
jgi:hypothetical protein